MLWVCGASDDAPLQEVVDGVDGAVVILLPLKCSESMETATPAADGSTTSGTLDDWLVPCEFMHRSRRVASRQRSRSYLPSSGTATTAETSQPADSVRLNRLESSALLERERRLESCAGRHSVKDPATMLRGAFWGAAQSTFRCYFYPLNRQGVASGAQALEIHFQKRSSHQEWGRAHEGATRGRRSAGG